MVNAHQVAFITQFQKCGYLPKLNLSSSDTTTGSHDGGMECHVEHTGYPLTVHSGVEWKVPYSLSAMAEYFRRNHESTGETPQPVTHDVLQRLSEEGICQKYDGYLMVSKCFL